VAINKQTNKILHMPSVSMMNSLFIHIYVGKKEKSMLHVCRDLEKMREDLGNSLEECLKIQKNLANFGCG
jgi:hypothetical protein